MKESPVVAVVCGGPSAEAEVSRVSGKCVAEALAMTYANVSQAQCFECMRVCPVGAQHRQLT